METKQQRDVWRKQTTAMVHSIADELEACRATAAMLFRERIRHSPPPYKRKPPFGIRLPSAAGDVRVIDGPHWFRHRKELDPGVLKVEVLWEVKISNKEHGTLWAPHCFLKVDIQPTGVAWTRCSLDDEKRDRAVRELAEIAVGFASDPMKTLARNSANCGVCGRALTDGQSKARGIGPECINKLDYFALKRSLFGTVEVGCDRPTVDE